jgi:predicted Zn-dependent protease
MPPYKSLPATLLLPGALILSTLLIGPSFAAGFWGETQTSPIYQRLPELENQLYGHAYPNQSPSQRINRLEKTLFGTTVFGPLEARMERIIDKMQERTTNTQHTQEPIIAYLEEKLFQKSFPEKPMPDRLRQLETHVFGRPFDHYPVPIRIKKLSYAMPLMAKEIRLTQGDTLIARSSGARPQRISRTGSISDTVQLDVQKAIPSIDEPSKARTGDDYFKAIHKNNNGSTLRWSKLPIRIFVKAATADEEPLTRQAIQGWQNSFSIEPTLQLQNADVVISWDKADWDQNPSMLLTRPVVRLSDSNTVRTIVLISLYPIRNIPTEHKLHIIAHQLGHAFGLWGHSDNPDDLMYPAFHWETNDFPSRWRWRSETSYLQTPPNAIESTLPSQRDINTLLRIYEQPANDLSVYTP